MIKSSMSHNNTKVNCTLVQALRLCTGCMAHRRSRGLYPFLTTALEGGEGSVSRPGHSLPPGKTRYPLYRRLDGLQGWSRQVWKISPQLGFDLRTVQPVAQSLYRLRYPAHHGNTKHCAILCVPYLYIQKYLNCTTVCILE